MNAIENLILNNVFAAVKQAVPGCDTLGEYAPKPATFPCVSMYLRDSKSYAESFDNEAKDNHITLTFECQAFSDLSAQNKEQAKKLSQIVDGEMAKMLFTRTYRDTNPSLDRSIYEVRTRYSAVVGEPITDESGTTVYQMYRIEQ